MRSPRGDADARFRRRLCLLHCMSRDPARFLPVWGRQMPAHGRFAGSGLRLADVDRDGGTRAATLNSDWLDATPWLQRQQPHRQRSRGVRRVRGCLLRNPGRARKPSGAVSRPTGCLWHAQAASCVPLQDARACGPVPLGGNGLGAIADPPPETVTAGRLDSRAIPLLPGAGRSHVNVGCHPRPAAANDRDFKDTARGRRRG
jgi:hypothetical protein